MTAGGPQFLLASRRVLLEIRAAKTLDDRAAVTLHQLPTVEPERLRELSQLAQSLRRDTAPAPGHTDPGAVADCWESLLDGLDELRRVFER